MQKRAAKLIADTRLQCTETNYSALRQKTSLHWDKLRYTETNCRRLQCTETKCTKGVVCTNLRRECTFQPTSCPGSIHWGKVKGVQWTLGEVSPSNPSYRSVPLDISFKRKNRQLVARVKLTSSTIPQRCCGGNMARNHVKIGRFIVCRGNLTKGQGTV